MLTLPIFVLAAVIGVVLAAVDGPYPHDKKLIDWISTVAVAAGAVVMVALVVRSSLID